MLEMKQKNDKHILLSVVGIILIAVLLGSAVAILPSTKAKILPIVLLAALGFSALSVFQLEKALLVTIFLLPVIPPAIGIEINPSLPLITFQRILILNLWFAIIVHSFSKNSNLGFPKLPRLAIYILVLFVFASLVSGVLTTSPLRSIYRILASLFDEIGLVLIILILSEKYEKLPYKILSVLFGSIVFLAFLGILDSLLNFNPLFHLTGARNIQFTGISRLGYRRGQGLMPQPMALAFLTALGAMLGFSMAAWKKNKKPIIICLALIIIALLFTFTRTGWVSFLIGCMLWFVLAKKQRSWLLLLAVLGLTALLTTNFGQELIDMVRYGLNVSTQNEVSTLLARTQWPVFVWNKMSMEPIRMIIGYGPGSSTDLWLIWKTLEMRAQFTNNLLIVFIEKGGFGLLILLSLLASVAWLAWRNLMKLGKKERNTGIFFVIAMAIVFGSSLTTPVFIWAQTNYVIWILIACVFAMVGERRKIQEQAT